MACLNGDCLPRPESCYATMIILKKTVYTFIVTLTALLCKPVYPQALNVMDLQSGKLLMRKVQFSLTLKISFSALSGTE